MFGRRRIFVDLSTTQKVQILLNMQKHWKFSNILCWPHSVFLPVEQLVFVDFEFLSERSVRVRIFIHATAAIRELQAEIGGRITVASVYV